MGLSPGPKANYHTGYLPTCTVLVHVAPFTPLARPASGALPRFGGVLLATLPANRLAADHPRSYALGPESILSGRGVGG